MRQGRESEATEAVFAYKAKKLLRTEVRTGFYYFIIISLCHNMSRAEVMRECDIHPTRSIKTNSDVNLSRKPVGWTSLL